MDLSFVETMRGELRAPSGGASPVELGIVAEARSLPRFLEDGTTRIRGLVRAPPWTLRSPAVGTLRLSLGAIAYRIELSSDGGEPLVLTGTKHPSILSPLRSMTVMQVSLHDGAGSELARGTMRFELADLPRFVASWLPMGKRSLRALDRRRRRVERGLLEG